MRFSALFRRLWVFFHKADASAAAIAALASSQSALTERLNEMAELHADLVRQFGAQKASADKQLSDLRAIVTQMGEQAKQRPAVARNMAEVRAFTGGDEG